MPVLVAVLLAACAAAGDVDAASSDVARDVRHDAGAPRPCASDEDCQLVPWCTSRWRCEPARGRVEARCVEVGPPPPCARGETCDSMMRACVGCRDLDGDAFAAAECGGSDCNDADPRVHPSQADGCDGADSDCDTLVDEDPDLLLYRDTDHDGYAAYGAESILGCVTDEDWSLERGDCIEGNRAVSPGAPELCDGQDNDCDGLFDGPGEDDDGDGYADRSCRSWDALGDCDDDDPSIHPRAVDVLCDGIDQDCSGGIPEDLDGDGVNRSPCGPDCNDRDPRILGMDADGDGHAPTSCGGDDCDDADPAVYRDAPQRCNGRDDACNWFLYRSEDVDGDGFVALTAACEPTPGGLPRTDCNDRASGIRPGAAEWCDGLDDDCDPASTDGSAAVNGCLPGHDCLGGSCRQTVALARRSPDETCALLLDGTTRCWGARPAACPEPVTSGGCYRPVDRRGWRGLVALAPDASCGVDAAGNVVGSFTIDPPGTPQARAVGPGCACRARADTGGLWCRVDGDMRGPRDVVQIDTTCARTRSGEVWCWGDNDRGQVGDGTTLYRPLPSRAIAGGAVDLASTNDERCAVMVDGTLHCWGNGTLVPTPLPGVAGATEIAALGVSSPTRFWIARGASDVERLDDGRTYPGTSGVRSLVVGTAHGCAIAPDDRVICFGSGDVELGLPAGTTSSGPSTPGGL